jgi:hypothetical protein
LGIPEPGGTGGTKGLPTSFLATALISPQEDVGAVLRNSLQGDSTTSGKQYIAAALQAVAQDPLFLALLKETRRVGTRLIPTKARKRPPREASSGRQRND